MTSQRCLRQCWYEYDNADSNHVLFKPHCPRLAGNMKNPAVLRLPQSQNNWRTCFDFIMCKGRKIKVLPVCKLCVKMPFSSHAFIQGQTMTALKRTDFNRRYHEILYFCGFICRWGNMLPGIIRWTIPPTPLTYILTIFQPFASNLLR